MEENVILSTDEGLHPTDTVIPRSAEDVADDKTTIEECERKNTDSSAPIVDQLAAESDVSLVSMREETQKGISEEDAILFQKEHPELDVQALVCDELFLRFCGSRFGNEPLSSLYGDYRDLIDHANQIVQARRELPISEHPNTNEASAETVLSKDQQEALDEWNTTYPYLEMTVEEFLTRSM